MMVQHATIAATAKKTIEWSFTRPSLDCPGDKGHFDGMIRASEDIDVGIVCLGSSAIIGASRGLEDISTAEIIRAAN